MSKIYTTTSQLDKDRIRSNLWIVKGKLKMTNAEIARLLNVSEGTVSNRFKHPDKLTLSEVFKLCKIAKIDLGKFVSDTLVID